MEWNNAIRIAEMPPALVDAICDDVENSEPVEIPEVIEEGQRNDTLHRVGSLFRAVGLSEEGIRSALDAENDARCDPPLSSTEIDGIVKSVMGYDVDEARDVFDRTAPNPRGDVPPDRGPAGGGARA